MNRINAAAHERETNSGDAGPHGDERPGSVIAPGVPRRVVLALGEHGCPKHALLRATELARMLDGRLHVLRVLSRPSRWQAAVNAIDDVQSSRHRDIAARATRSWLAILPGHQALIECVVIGQGDFVRVAAAHAERIAASLMVVAPDGDTLGNTVTALARASNTPVLVARAPWIDGTVLAATDLESEGFPVLSKAAELGMQLDVPLVAVHSVDPEPTGEVDLAWTVPNLSPVNTNHPMSAQRLVDASTTLPIDAQKVVVDEVDPAEAIFAQARLHRADLVVVGTRRRSWLDWLLSDSVAARVVNRERRRSVLVVPLDEKHGAFRRRRARARRLRPLEFHRGH